MVRTSSKRIVHYRNGSYIKEMGRTSRKVGRTTTEQGNVSYVLRKWTVTDGKELGQHSESQARVPSAIFFFFECFKSEVLSEYKGLLQRGYKRATKKPDLGM